MCPLGAIQDIVVLKPVQLPLAVDRWGGLFKYVYLAAAVWFAVLPAGSRDFIICRFDPFVGFFRLNGSALMLFFGGGLLLLGTVVGRPYCRFLCPYGGLLAIVSRFALKPVSITPDEQLDCGLCAESCPFGAIRNLRADRADCLACARCFADCPRQLVQWGEIELIEIEDLIESQQLGSRCEDGVSRMKERTQNSGDLVIIASVLVVLISAIAVLMIDWAMNVGSADELAERLEQAEVAAREDPAAAAAFDALVEEQTAISLSRNRRQRVASITALVAAGLFIVLAKPKRSGQPTLPRLVADAVTLPEPASPSPSCAEQPSPCAQVVPPVDLAPVEAIVRRVGCEQRHLIPLLHAINEHYRYLPQQALARLAESTSIAHEQIAGVASFYTQFRTRPRGEHVVRVCRGTPVTWREPIASTNNCAARSAFRQVKIPIRHKSQPSSRLAAWGVALWRPCSKSTTRSLDTSMWKRCRRSSTGATRHKNGLAPPTTRSPTVTQPLMEKANPQLTTPPLEIRIGVGSCCVAGGSRDVLNSLEREIAARHLDAVIKPVGCVGICHLTPLVEVIAPGAEPVVATRATPADVRRIIRMLPDQGPWTQRWRNRLADVWQRETTPENGSSSSCQICPVGDATCPSVCRSADPNRHRTQWGDGSKQPRAVSRPRRLCRVDSDA